MNRRRTRRHMERLVHGRDIATAGRGAGFASGRACLESFRSGKVWDRLGAAMERAVLGAQREQREGASGKWVAHWKMVHIVRPVWERAGAPNQMGRGFLPLGYRKADADDLCLIEP